MERGPYAVPLSDLVARAAVAVDLQVQEVEAVPPPAPVGPGVLPLGPDGGDADGD